MCQLLRILHQIARSWIYVHFASFNEVNKLQEEKVIYLYLSENIIVLKISVEFVLEFVLDVFGVIYSTNDDLYNGHHCCYRLNIINICITL